jgi:hypothetical protein
MTHIQYHALQRPPESPCMIARALYLSDLRGVFGDWVMPPIDALPRKILRKLLGREIGPK